MATQHRVLYIFFKLGIGVFFSFLDHVKGWNLIVFLWLLLRDTELPHHAASVTWASCQEFSVLAELALQHVVVGVSGENLHRLELFTLRLPEETSPYIISGNKFFSWPRDGDWSEGGLIRINIQLFCHIFDKVPDSDSALVVAKNNLTLVRVEHCAINHHSAIIKVAHVPCSFKVKDLESAIFRCCEEPFIILLEAKCSNVALVTLEQNFAAGLDISAQGNFVNFHNIVSGHAQVLSIVSYGKFIDVRFGVGNLSCRQARSDIPELNGVVVSCSDYY